MQPMSPPVSRLSDRTRRLAARARSGEWGRSMTDPHLVLDDVGEWRTFSPHRQFAECISLIAAQAPLRIVPGEKVVGSATLLPATRHTVPVYSAESGEPAFRGTSHTTLGFDRALDIGYAGLRQRIEERIARGGLEDEGREVLESMRTCLEALLHWQQRHVDLLERWVAESSGRERRQYREVLNSLRPVPENPPENFRQAVQSLWMSFCFQRLCGNWPGIGRMDKMLGPYLRRDLGRGAITLEEARELLAHFWIKGCDWVGVETERTGGDAQFYQNVVLAGVDEDGEEVTNEVTYLILDVVEELRINEFPIAVRIGPSTPQALLRRVAEVQRLGGGMVAVYNEPQIIRSLVDFGYPPEEARDFANDGCWEVIVPGKTSFGYCPFDTLALLQEVLGVTTGGAIPRYESFEALYAAFRRRLAEQVAEVQSQIDGTINSTPAPLASLLVEGCIENARGYNAGGPKYTVRAPHAGGIPDVANSLLVIRKLVFEEGRLSLEELVEVLRADWEGHEGLRREINRSFDFYGNDAAEADAMARRVFDDFLEEVGRVRDRAGVLRPPGVSTFGREIQWRPQRGATAGGRHEGDILAMNFSPSPGTDRRGPTAVIKSHCAMGLERLTNGTALELKLHPSSVEDGAAVEAMVALMRSFVQLGGIFLHVDVVDDEVLREAQRNPEDYQGLAVRVSGWSARFVTLDEEWQEMVINRTTQGME